MTITSISTREFGDAAEFPDGRPRPRTAVVREVDITEKGQISINFVRGNVVDVSDETKFKAMLQDVGAGKPGTGKPFATGPKGEHLSPLSMNNQGLNYLVFVLTGKNWQFASKGSPITIGKGATKNAYFDSHRVDGSGKADKGETEKDGCRAAYVIADGDAAINGKPKYEDMINLHVDLLFKSPDGTTQRMPIIIDPDIRHPGGSEPEP